MKLLISLSYYSPHISGLTLALRHLAELLQRNGYTVTVLAAQHKKNLPDEEKINEVTVVRVPYFFRVNKGFFMPGFSKTAFRLLQKNDVVLLTLPQVQSLTVAIVAKLLRKKIVCLYICEVTLSGGFLAKIVNSMIRLINRTTLLLADQIVTLTDDFAVHTANLKEPEKKVAGIYPVIIPPRIIQAEIDALQKRVLRKKYYIGYLGRIASEKGIVHLLEAIPSLQKILGTDFAVIFAGPKKTVGEELYRKKVESLFKKYSKFVIQLGELSDAQVGAFYSLLDVFVLPTTNNTEAFGMVQVEAMYCGTPVVTTDLPGVRVPVQKTGMGEIVPPGNVSALAQAIEKILKNKRQYRKQRELIEDIFSEKKIVLAYQRLFTV